MTDQKPDTALPFHMPAGADPKAVDALIRANPKLHKLVQDRKNLEQKIKGAQGTAQPRTAQADQRYHVDSPAARSAATQKWTDKRDALRLKRAKQASAQRPQPSKPTMPRPTKRAVDNFIPPQDRPKPVTPDLPLRDHAIAKPDWITQRDQIAEQTKIKTIANRVKAAHQVARRINAAANKDDFDFDHTGVLKPTQVVPLTKPPKPPPEKEFASDRPKRLVKPAKPIKDREKSSRPKPRKNNADAKRNSGWMKQARFCNARDAKRPVRRKGTINDRLDRQRDAALARRHAAQDDDPPFNKKKDKIDRFQERWF